MQLLDYDHTPNFQQHSTDATDFICLLTHQFCHSLSNLSTRGCRSTYWWVRTATRTLTERKWPLKGQSCTKHSAFYAKYLCVRHKVTISFSDYTYSRDWLGKKNLMFCQTDYIISRPGSFSKWGSDAVSRILALTAQPHEYEVLVAWCSVVFRRLMDCYIWYYYHLEISMF